MLRRPHHPDRMSLASADGQDRLRREPQACLLFWPSEALSVGRNAYPLWTTLESAVQFSPGRHLHDQRNNERDNQALLAPLPLGLAAASGAASGSALPRPTLSPTATIHEA